MKILHIHPSMAGGGIEAMICGLANTMAKKENVTVCSIFEPKSTDVFWHKLEPSVRKLTLNKIKPGFSIAELFKIFNILRKEKFDVVNMHGFLYYYVIAVLFLHKKTKFFYTVHSDAEKENSRWDSKIYFFKKYCFKSGWVHPITISAASEQSFEKIYDLKGRTIYNGVQPAKISKSDAIKQYRYTKNTKVFLHAGRIDTPKNQIVLCKVFDKLIKEGKDVVLLIAGAKQNSDIYSKLEQYFSERIQYLGERSDIPDLMAYSDAMCLSSIWEGLPVTLLEALSVGCIPICTPVGGIPDVIKNDWNGILSTSASEEDYFQAVKRFLLMSDIDYSKMKSDSMTSFERYDIQNTANSYLEYYREIL